jgi:Gpi18-like mannosyltransferase
VQGFINEMANTAGLGGTIVISRALVSAPAIHGKITIAAGVFVITQIISIDDDTVTVAAMADMRISPAGMRQ